ncbi:hypothetical protein GBAR_LOCUS15088 [Geodia barretti]|uniref:Uncharacterized protein n=1 Tax=Geodia barretti TaxID=519541 RepID=A0AA35WTS4_GEOBA|nr:hypothetical protein GBAR_LOCUS15088 [Geodia barretti]
MHDDSRSPMAGICGHTVFHTHACVYNIYAPFPCVMCHDGKRFTRHSSTCVSPEVSLYIQGVMLGKRKSLMKSIELREKRKRRREELEQEQQLAQEQDDKDKSSAWKAYMAQVKAYEARNCTDSEGHRRPLVK